MPSIAEAHWEEPVCGKKRRIEESEGFSQGGGIFRVSSSDHLSHSEYPFSNIQHRRLITPKSSLRQDMKRQRISTPPHTFSSHHLHQSTGFSSSRPEMERSKTYPQIHPSQQQSYTTPSNKPKQDLSPCHICHRKPTVRHELDAFANCEGCEKRTCWICIRECLGYMPTLEREQLPSGEHIEEDAIEEDERTEDRGNHRRMICSRCCVERGSEGDVWCLGCLRSESGGDGS